MKRQLTECRTPPVVLDINKLDSIPAEHRTLAERDEKNRGVPDEERQRHEEADTRNTSDEGQNGATFHELQAQELLSGVQRYGGTEGPHGLRDSSHASGGAEPFRERA